MSDIEQHIKKYYLEINEEIDAILGLEVLLSFLQKTLKNKRYWVWVFISLHKTLQSFMVLALQGTDSRRLLKPVDNGKKPEMHSFLTLYAMIKKSDWMVKYTESKPFKTTGSQGKSIKFLNTMLRNNFIHFSPNSWLIEVSGMPKILEDCLDVIEFLALRCGNVYWNNSADEQRLKEPLPILRREATDLKIKYN